MSNMNPNDRWYSYGIHCRYCVILHHFTFSEVICGCECTHKEVYRYFTPVMAIKAGQSELYIFHKFTSDVEDHLIWSAGWNVSLGKAENFEVRELQNLSWSSVYRLQKLGTVTDLRPPGFRWASHQCCSPPPRVYHRVSTSSGSYGHGTQPGSWQLPCWPLGHPGGCPWCPLPPAAGCSPPVTIITEQNKFSNRDSISIDSFLLCLTFKRSLLTSSQFNRA